MIKPARMRIMLGLGLLSIACTPSDPPGATRASAAPAATSAAMPEPARDAGLPADSGVHAVAATHAESVLGAEDGSLDLTADDAALAQTEDAPKSDEPLTQARAKALFEAMRSGDAKRGEVFFFPLEAYKQVKDSSNPESDWRNRLLANYARDVKELQRARPNLQNAHFVALQIPETGSRWVKPGEEYNKIGYYRVFNAQLAYETAEGAPKTIPLKSLISWRGRFYVVHLSSMK